MTQPLSSRPGTVNSGSKRQPNSVPQKKTEPFPFDGAFLDKLKGGHTQLPVSTSLDRSRSHTQAQQDALRAKLLTQRDNPGTTQLQRSNTNNRLQDLANRQQRISAVSDAESQKLSDSFKRMLEKAGKPSSIPQQKSEPFPFDGAYLDKLKGK